MRILILNWRDPKNPRSGGAEIVTIRHARAWVEAGHEVVWFTSGFKDALKREIINGVEIIRKGNSFSVYLLAPFFYLFSGREFDVVIDEIHGLPFFTPIYVKKPIIAFIHEVAGEIWDHMYPFPLNQIGKAIESFYFRLYNKLQFWTDAESTIFELEKHGIKPDNCKAIACPINNKSLSELPLKEKMPTFIFVSRIVKMKGIEDVIRAFEIIAKKNIFSRLWIVGDGEKRYIHKLKKMVKEYKIEKNVRFFGRVSESEKLSLMRKAHLLLHASVKEGWGLVVVEAASQATPSVVYNVCGLCDSVKDGETGVVIKNNLPDELSKQANLLLADQSKYRIFQRNCLNWAKSLNWKEVTGQSLGLLSKMVGK